uniref:Ubiquitin-like protease family profile domain-containing protein n=1 Tax=Oryza rufipogon TaxID=4529 RepID=A0A0E0NY58_ORYRU
MDSYKVESNDMIGNSSEEPNLALKKISEGSYDSLEIQPLKKAKISECNDFESNNQIDYSPSQTLNKSEPLLHETQKYNYLPQDYEMTENDLCTQITIETSSPTDTLVEIDGIIVRQDQLLCLLDGKKFLNDDVISAYIYCIRDQTHLRRGNNSNIYIETPFISGLLKRDGDIGVDEDSGIDNFMTKIARNYLKHELLQGLEYHFSILERQQNLISHNWKDLRITTWRIMEKLREPIQRDGKVWVRSSKPYSISLSLRKLQKILMEDQPMDRDCFNLAVRKFAYDDIQLMKKNRGTISKHYLDLQFWIITEFGRHPDYRQQLNIEQLVDSICSWPDIDYNVSKCKLILIPVQYCDTFILIVLDQDTRTLYVLDPTPIDPIYENNPNARYVKQLLCITEYLAKAMAKVCPGSRWNEDINLWRQIFLSNVPIQSRELSGYLVSLFMRTCRDDGTQFPILKDGFSYEVRKHFLAQLLEYAENECESNIPSGIRDLLRFYK